MTLAAPTLSASPPPDPLARAFAADPDALARLRAPLDGGAGDAVTTAVTDSGPVVVVAGRALHSRRDPEREARRFARALDLERVDVVVLRGYGSGHVARAIAERTEATLLVFEPDLAALREGLGHGEVPERVYIVTAVERLVPALYGALTNHARGLIVTWAPSVRTHPDVHAAALERAHETIERVSVRARTARLRVGGWLGHALDNLPRALAGATLSALRGRFEDCTAIIAAAGPSLDRNVALLRERPPNTLLLAVNTAAGALARAGVRPDAIVAVESIDVSRQLSDLPWLREVPILLELTASPALWRLPFAAHVGIAVDTSATHRFAARLDPGMTLAGGFCVANTATAIAHALGCHTIALVGSDLAYAAGRAYASGTLFEGMRAEVDASGQGRFAGLEAKRLLEAASPGATGGNRMPERFDPVWVPGWNGGAPVPTTHEFVAFRDWYTQAALELATVGVRTIDATEGGAAIPGFEPRTLAQVLQQAAQGVEPLAQGSVARRLLDAARGPGPDQGHVQRELAVEHGHVIRLIELGERACALLADDPDGDVNADVGTLAQLAAIHDEARERLSAAPLAIEATHGNAAAIRERGETHALAIYRALDKPLRELATELARLLHNTDPFAPEPFGAPPPHGPAPTQRRAP
jgi:hypothetical protein